MHVITSSRKLLVHLSSKFIPTLICPCILSLDEMVVCSSRKACFSVQRHHFYRRLGAVGNLTGWAWQILVNGMIPHSQKYIEPVHVANAFERPTQSWKRLQACSCCVCGGFAEHSHCVLFTLYVSSMTHWLGQQVLCIDSLSVKWGQPVVQRLSWGGHHVDFFSGNELQQRIFSQAGRCNAKEPARTSTPFGSTGQKTTPRWWLSILETFDFGGQPRRRCHSQPACAGQAGRPLWKWVEIMRWWFYDIMFAHVFQMLYFHI